MWENPHENGIKIWGEPQFAGQHVDPLNANMKPFRQKEVGGSD